MPKYRLSQLTTARELHEQMMQDPAYRAEWERTALARAVSHLVLSYRVEHKLTQTAFARLVGIPQSQVSRLEGGDHNPSLDTLAKLAQVLDIELVVDIVPAKRKRKGLSKAAATKPLGEFALGESQVLVAAV